MQNISLKALILLAVTVFTVSRMFSQYVTRQFAVAATPGQAVLRSATRFVSMVER
ncbi:hypothetical protein [Paraburkholderia fungorum]|uniref:hypothetical protein n=1 Tax=Paraburkholderia fungorum TaxID=134537 RepID=UPI001600CBDE|nr:hypothetical protein [Paraburkholderia fungorum]